MFVETPNLRQYSAIYGNRTVFSNNAEKKERTKFAEHIHYTY